MTEEVKSVSLDDIEATFVVPTISANRFIVTSSPESFRIAFGESAYADSTVYYRVAVGLTMWEAHELREVLNSLLVPYEEKINEIKAAIHGDATA